MSRTRSGSITPAYSTDRALLLSHYPDTKTVASLEEAKIAVSKFGIFEDTTFKKRVPLETDADWYNFASSCRDESGSESGAYSLEMLLKKCYAAAYSMPPSPNSTARSQQTSSSPPAAIRI
eukprot:CAMPEP_0197261550 /NCGR_PEP_ID=MMETSP1429-20130617/84602_1 /TAXON_ID=49237 /ORGANISM="Chaetoceros  sp., Strain UNC1202" /LENGTH=120 /DNA_ID=CAMNT_0042725821 /DNA_START=221 /DNA_END=583 /DNA_ORIENTATION=+